MKKLLSILFILLSLRSFCQTNAKVGPGEYVSLGLLVTTVYNMSGGIPVVWPGAPQCKAVFGGAHHAAMIDINDTLWTVDDNSAGQLGIGSTTGSGTPVKVTRDSLGHGFGNVAGVSCGGTTYANYWNTLVWKKDGTGWISGNTQGGAAGNGTQGAVASTYFIQIPFPVGTFIVKMISGTVDLALDSAGNVWTWGGGGNLYILARGNSANWLVPGKVTLVGGTRAIDIAGGGYWNYAILNTGHTDTWGYYSDYMGLGPQGTPAITTTPIDATSYYNFPSPPVEVEANNECSYVRLADSTVRSWGGNAVGTIGNGIELNYALYGTPPPYGTTNPMPYDWDQGQHELMQITPVNPAPGIHNFTKIYTSNALVYSVWWQDVTGQLYANGRNKVEIANGIVPGAQVSGQQQAIYPNSWDVPYITKLNPWSIPNTIQVPSPWCVTHPGTPACSLYPIPNVAGPKSFAGNNQSTATTSILLHGSTTSASNTPIIYHIWKRISGPNIPLFTLPSDSLSLVSGLITGTYVFQYNITDANQRQDSSQVTITVGNTPPLVVISLSSSIILPSNFVTLNGTITGGSGIVVLTQWTQISGPSTAVITSSGTPTTVAKGLIAGVYTFRLSATDSNNNSGSATVTVTVNSSLTVPTTGVRRLKAARLKISN